MLNSLTLAPGHFTFDPNSSPDSPPRRTLLQHTHPPTHPPTPAMAFVTGPALPSARAARASATCTVRMSADSREPVSRRALIAGVAAAAAAAALPKGAFAEREYPNVEFLGGSDVIDVNNANVRAYTKFKGFYPTLAGMIVANGPYKSVDELFELPDLSPEQKIVLEKYKDNLTALEPTPEYELDKFNNGLYR